MTILMMIILWVYRNKRAVFKRVPGHRAILLYFLGNIFLQLGGTKLINLNFISFAHLPRAVGGQERRARSIYILNN